MPGSKPVNLPVGGGGLWPLCGAGFGPAPGDRARRAPDQLTVSSIGDPLVPGHLEGRREALGVEARDKDTLRHTAGFFGSTLPLHRKWRPPEPGSSLIATDGRPDVGEPMANRSSTTSSRRSSWPPSRHPSLR